MRQIIDIMDGKVYGDTFKYAIQQEETIFGDTYFTFGEHYKDAFNDFYSQQGCKSFKTANEAIKELFDFCGLSVLDEDIEVLVEKLILKTKKEKVSIIVSNKYFLSF